MTVPDGTPAEVLEQGMFVWLRRRSRAPTCPHPVYERSEHGLLAMISGAVSQDGYVEVDQVERSAATLGHAGASVALAVPIEREGGRMAPGVGLAVAVDRRLAGSPVSDVTSWGVFLTTPTTVAIGSLALTLDTSAGVYRTDFFRAGQPWTFALDAAVRVDF